MAGLGSLGYTAHQLRCLYQQNSVYICCCPHTEVSKLGAAGRPFTCLALVANIASAIAGALVSTLRR